jgi:signal transduction histidine kinase
MSQDDTGQIALKSVDVFEGVADEVLGKIRAYMTERRAEAGTVLFVEGEQADGVFFVRSGTVQIVKSQDGHASVLARRGRGELIGEMALVDSSLRFATAICETDCDLFVLSRARFIDILSAQPAIAERVMRVMTARVREADVKRLRQLEEKNRELEAARARLEAALTYRDRVLAFSPYPIVVTETSNVVRLVNHAALLLFGPHHDRRLWDWVAPRDQQIPALSEARLNGGAAWHAEIELTGPNGVVLTCKVAAAPIADTGDGRSARLWIFEDLTEMRAIQSRAVDRERLALKGEMAGEIAHELNNYLAVLMGNLELLPMLMGDNTPPAVTRSLGSIQQALSQIVMFTGNLLRSRHPAGIRAEINLNEFLQNQIAFMRPQKRLKKIVIQTEWDASIPPFECDCSGLQQVFYNLLLNAADALSESDSRHHTAFVTTRFNRDQDAAELIVADDGPGIAPEVMKQMFRERVSTKATGHGFGLLTISRIVEEHGAKISVGSREGGGAEFVISLPINKPSS